MQANKGRGISYQIMNREYYQVVEYYPVHYWSNVNYQLDLYLYVKEDWDAFVLYCQ